MEVTVGGMDAGVEPIGIYSRRVTGMQVINHSEDSTKIPTELVLSASKLSTLLVYANRNVTLRRSHNRPMGHQHVKRARQEQFDKSPRH